MSPSEEHEEEPSKEPDFFPMRNFSERNKKKIKENFIEAAESYTTRKPKGICVSVQKTSELKNTVAELKNIVNNYVTIKIDFKKCRKF